MIIPRFSIRNLLIITALAGCFSLVVSQAVQGADWAIGFSIAALSLVVLAMLFAITFVMAMVFHGGTRAIEEFLAPPKGSSPFASSGPPPQQLPPSEPV